MTSHSAHHGACDGSLGPSMHPLSPVHDGNHGEMAVEPVKVSLGAG